VAAYGVLGAALAGVLVAGKAVTVATTAVVGAVLGTSLGAFSGLPRPGTAALPSVAAADPLTAVGSGRVVR